MRWLNRDPIGESGGLGLYSFCENNGIVKVDPLGHAVYLVLAGMEYRANVFEKQKNNMATAMRTARQALVDLSSLTEKQFRCLKRKRAVFFNQHHFSGTLEEYKKRIEHELKSYVRVCRSYSESVSTIRHMANQVEKDWDCLVYFAHGSDGQRLGLQTMLSFSEGNYDQRAALDEVSRNMISSVGSKLVISCYQTWDGHGAKPLHVETITHEFPRAKFIVSGAKTILSYTTHKITRGVK